LKNRIQHIIQESINVKKAIFKDEALTNRIELATSWCIHTFQNEGKVLFCGNGGSAADAQHLAAEFSGRFYKDRAPLFAEALHVNTSFLTAVANDYSFERTYARMVQAMGKPGDILFGITTSGNSSNVILAIEEAKRLGMKTIAMTGASGGQVRDICDLLLNMPSIDTPRIQEAHIMVGHIICELVEADLFD
jgi:D-sedoheptulose 7-phosphate isomerase